MNMQKYLFLLLLTVAPLCCAQEQKEETNEAVEQQESHKAQYDEFDVVTQEFEDFELEKPTNFQEPSRMQVWATALGLALLIKYIEMREVFSDWHETASDWWESFLVFCHLKSERKKETDEQESQA